MSILTTALTRCTALRLGVIALFGTLLLCTGCSTTHTGRVSVPVLAAGTRVAARNLRWNSATTGQVTLNGGYKLKGSTVRFDLPEALIRVRADNYRLERGKETFLYLPVSRFGPETKSFHSNRLDILIDIQARTSQLTWWPSHLLYIAEDGSTNMPLPGVLEGADLRSTTLVKDDPLTITKPAGLLRWRRGPFWVSFEVDSDPARPFSLILDGLQCGGKRIELPRIDFREGTEHRTEYQYQEYSFFLW